MKNLSKVSLILCLVITVIIGYALGYFICSTNPPIQSVSFQDIPKNELVITSDFFKVEPMTYSFVNGKEYLKTTISLTERGKNYISTQLFIDEYDVKVYLVNNSNNDLYLSYSNLEWNINEVKKLELLIDKKEVIDEKSLSEFNTQLELLNKSLDTNLVYSVEISPKLNSENIMRTVGMLHK